MASKRRPDGTRITGRQGMKIETIVSQRVGRLMSNPKKVFSPKERAVINQLCRANGWDYNLTGKMVGMNPKTLKMWRYDTFTEEIDSTAKAVIDQLVIRIAGTHPEDGVVVIPNVTQAMERIDMGVDKIIDKAVSARTLAIDRILEIIPQEKRVDNLLSVIKEMNILIQNDSDQIKEGGGSILPALQKMANGASINQEEMMASIMGKLNQSSFIQINNYQKDTTEDVEVVIEEAKTE
jgi:hypothetical protein